MKNYIKKISVVMVFILLNGCETWRNDCGKIIVKNELDDLTLKIGENYYRDLFAEPVVLEHSKDKTIQIIVEGGGVIADAYRSHSNTTGQLNALEIDARKTGATEITVVAYGGCQEEYLNFKLIVTE